MPRLLSACALAGWMCVTTAVLAANEPTPTQIREAAEAFDRGREAYKTEDWVAAAEQFERADAQAPSPTALEYAIRSRDKAGQPDRAATLAALALNRYPEDANLGKLATELLERVRPGLFELSVGCAEPCDLAVGGKIIPGSADTQRTIFLAEGKHTIRAGFSGGRGDSHEVEAVVGTRAQITFEAAAAPPVAATPAEPVADEPPPTPPPPSDQGKNRSGWSPTVFWVGAGLTGVLAGVTTWSGIDTLNNPGKDKVKAECGANDTSCDLYQEGLAHQKRTNILIGVTAGVGVATALIGILATDWGGSEASSSEALPASNHKKARARERARIVPWLEVGNGAMVGAEGRF